MARRAPDHPGRPARRPAAAGGRRPGDPAGRVRRSRRPSRPRCAASTTKPRPEAGGGVGAAGRPRGRRSRRCPERTDAAQQTWFRLSALAERVNATVRIASERAQYLEPADRQQRARSRRAGGRGGRGGRARAAAARRAERGAGPGWRRRPRRAGRAPKAPPPRPSVPTWRRCGRRPIAARAWPGWPVRSRRARPVESIDDGVARLTAAIEEAARAPSRRRPSSRSSRAASANSTRARSGLDEHHDRTVAARCGWPTSGSPNCRPPSAAPNARSFHCRPASTRSRWAWSVRTARRGFVENRSGSGLFGTIAKLVKVIPIRDRTGAVLGRPPTRSRPTTPAPPGRGARAQATPTAGRAIVLADWPAAQHRTPLPGDALGAGPDRRRRGCGRDERDARRRRGGARSGRRAGSGGRPPDAAGRSPSTAIWWAGLGHGGSGPQAQHAGDRVRDRQGQSRTRRRRALVGELTAALAGALDEQSNRQDAAEQALAALNESDAAISAIYEQLGRLGSEMRAPRTTGGGQVAQRDELEAGRVQTVDRTHRAGEPAARAAQDIGAVVDQPVDRQQMQAAAESARGAEVEARLAVRTAEERANAVRGRADSLRRAAAAERERGCAPSAPAPANTPRRWRPRSPRPGWSPNAHRRGRAASRTRDALAAERQQRATAMAAAREEVAVLNARIGALTDSLHRDEVAKAQAAAIEQLEQMVLEQFGMAADDLDRRIRPRRGAAAVGVGMAEYEQARERGEQVTRPRRCRSTGPTRSAAPNGRNGNWPSSAGSTRWRSRSSRRWRSATTSCPPSSRTSRPPARTCWT